MYKDKRISVIIPAFNEEEALPGVLAGIPAYVDEVIVGDNNSSDRTAEKAREGGARVVLEKKTGYGNACMRAMTAMNTPDIVVFLDGDNSDYPEEMYKLLDPIIDNNFDTVISNRFTDKLEKGAMSLPQYFGNKLAVFLIRIFWGYAYKDLGPFRSITRQALERLEMCDPNYGWTVELQVKALEYKLKIDQVDVLYRCRTKGRSKVSGTLKGVVFAGYKIIYKILFYKLTENRR